MIFYDHLIVFEELTAELDSLDAEDRQEILSLMDETLHHRLLDTILTNLPKEHHKKFLERFHKAPHDPELLVFLKERSPIDIEEALKTKAKKIKRDLLLSVKKSRHHT